MPPEFIGLVLVLVAVAGVAHLRRRWRRRRWHAATHTVRGTTIIEVCRGPRGLLEQATIAEVPVAAYDYDQKLADAEATAYDKVAALNAAERVNRRRR